jgi:hypothetical protein
MNVRIILPRRHAPHHLIVRRRRQRQRLHLQQIQQVARQMSAQHLKVNAHASYLSSQTVEALGNGPSSTLFIGKAPPQHRPS